MQVELCTLVSLKKLDMSKNLIMFLPEEIGNLANLQHLDLLGKLIAIDFVTGLIITVIIDHLD